MTNQDIADIISIKLGITIPPQHIQIISRSDIAIVVKVNNMNEKHTVLI